MGVARPTDYAGTMRRIRPRGVQRGEAPLRFSLSPFAKGGSRGIGLGMQRGWAQATLRTVGLPRMRDAIP